MKFIQPLYLCYECKKIVSSLDQLLFVEDHTSKGFCSEACIEDFYRPLITFFSSQEIEIRKSLKLEHERISTDYDDKQLAEIILANPDETHEYANELGEKYYSLIKKVDDFFGIIVCLMNNQEATFIFLMTKTTSNRFIEKFRSTTTYQNNSESTNSISEEDYNFIQNLESKKSRILADLLTKKKDTDIPFEDFSNYEFCFDDCINDPDEVFESKDSEGDTFFNYIKSFNVSGENYFYIVLCLKRSELENEKEVSVFPVLAFPTNDLELYRDYSSGIRISGKLRN